MRGARNAWPVLLAALGLVLAGCNGGDDGDADPDVAYVTPPLFRFLKFAAAVRTDDGGEVTLKGLSGRVVMLNLFGTWSPQCRRIAPVLVSQYQRFHDQGLEIVGLAYEQTADTAQATRAVEAFRSEFGVPFILALGPEVLWEELRDSAGVRGVLPTIVLMDRQGVVRDVFEGLPPGHEAVVADRLERLLAEPAVPVP
ncbi:MAG: TlpA family protein disulfide reductase [Planctomycetes bacterium]|nr:TlpA family protein disulfide reductase [Planctomycetota bacterium]